MKLNELKDNEGAVKKKKRVARGVGLAKEKLLVEEFKGRNLVWRFNKWL